MQLLIQQVSLNHGSVPYQFMLHKSKLGLLRDAGFPQMRNFLRETFSCCPLEPFLSGPRSSRLRFSLGIKPEMVDSHEVAAFAREALSWNRFSTAHANVQRYMLANDLKTFGVEIPVWISPDELKSLTGDDSICGEKGWLSGHIDLMRLEGDRLWVWDYKPKAVKEKYAATQVFFYSLMLSRRTGIPLESFSCGYFDDKSSFVFRPESSFLKSLNQ